MQCERHGSWNTCDPWLLTCIVFVDLTCVLYEAPFCNYLLFGRELSCGRSPVRQYGDGGESSVNYDWAFDYESLTLTLKLETTGTIESILDTSSDEIEEGASDLSPGGKNGTSNAYLKAMVPRRYKKKCTSCERFVIRYLNSSSLWKWWKRQYTIKCSFNDAEK